MTKAQERAREFAEKWRITARQEFGYRPQQLESYVVEDIKHRLEEAFLAGYAQGQRDLVEAAEGERRDVIERDGPTTSHPTRRYVLVSKLKELAGVKDDNKA